MDRALGELAASLSERESQLLNLAAQGFTDNAISYKLGISLATVGTYWGRVRIKFGPLNRTELVAKYLNEQAEINQEQLREENRQLLDELSEKGHTVDVLRTSLDLFRGLIETAPDAILLVSEDGRIELANEQAEEMFGYSKDELLGMSIEHLVPDRYAGEHAQHRDEYHNNPIKRRMGEHLATHAKRKDASEFLMATALSSVQTQGGLLITCIVRDLTDRPIPGKPDED